MKLDVLLMFLSYDRKLLSKLFSIYHINISYHIVGYYHSGLFRWAPPHWADGPAAREGR